MFEVWMSITYKEKFGIRDELKKGLAYPYKLMIISILAMLRVNL